MDKFMFKVFRKLILSQVAVSWNELIAKFDYIHFS